MAIWHLPRRVALKSKHWPEQPLSRHSVTSGPRQDVLCFWAAVEDDGAVPSARFLSCVDIRTDR